MGGQIFCCPLFLSPHAGSEDIIVLQNNYMEIRIPIKAPKIIVKPPQPGDMCNPQNFFISVIIFRFKHNNDCLISSSCATFIFFSLSKQKNVRNLSKCILWIKNSTSLVNIDFIIILCLHLENESRKYVAEKQDVVVTKEKP